MRISDWSSDVCSSDLVESREPSGLVRIGCSEAYGTTILPRHLVDLASTYPNFSVDLLALPRVIQLPRNEADIVLPIDRPARGPYVSVQYSESRRVGKQFVRTSRSRGSLYL